MAAATITASVVTGGSNNHATSATEVNGMATDFISQGVVGTLTNTSGVAPMTGNFAVNQDTSPDMGVTITAGVAYVTGTPTGAASQNLRAYMSTNYTSYTINSNTSGSTKYDWIYLQLSASGAANPNADGSGVISLLTSRSSSNVSDNGSPPTYGILLAVVTVANNASSITNANITDKRTQASLSVPTTTATTGWQTPNGVISAVTYNGNRSYSLTTSVDNSTLISAGDRIMTTRTVAAPTQCASLNGTNNSFSKASPSGMTFTGNFACMAWVKITAYPSAQAGIIGRDSAGGSLSGWEFDLDTSGRVVVYWRNASGFSSVNTTQAIPLNKWVHIAASATVATPTAAIYIDGISVPISVSSSAATSVVQASTNLTIGNRNSTSGFFSGKLAQVAVFSSTVSQATIQGYISQTLAGTETNEISAYSFSNNINDLNANANNLTNNNSTSITTADSPFGGQASGSISSTLDYGIVQSINSTTIVAQAAEGCTFATSGGISTFNYSIQKSPYGFPAQLNKWRITSIWPSSSATTSNASYGAFQSAGFALTVGIGSWVVGWASGGTYNQTTTAVYFNISSTALTGLSNTAGSQASPFAARIQSSSAAQYMAPMKVEQMQDLAAQSTYVMYTLGATTSAGIDGSTTLTEIYAVNAYA